jgi:ubiquinone/menaquinone biosynthesis C-methylase UbiE
MRILTVGRLERVHRDITQRLEPGAHVLDIGCGTGALAVLLARKGIQVTGLDISPQMLSQATRRVREEELGHLVKLRELGAVNLDVAFDGASFDAVVSTLVFSELSDDEIEYTLAECHRILRGSGRLLVADEVLPDSALGRLSTLILRLPFALLAFLLTQNTTHRVARLGERIEHAGFRVVDGERYLAGTLRLYVAQKANRS